MHLLWFIFFQSLKSYVPIKSLSFSPRDLVVIFPCEVSVNIG